MVDDDKDSIQKKSAKKNKPDSIEKKRRHREGILRHLTFIETASGERFYRARSGRIIRARVLEELVDDLGKKDEDQAPKSLLEKSFFALKVFFFLAVFANVIIFMRVYGKEHGVNKEDIQSKIRMIVSNGGELGTIKHVYENRERYKASLSEFYKKLPETYDYETPLSTILKDIKAEIYIQKNPGDSNTLLVPLDKIISDHDTSNPFDKLEIAQKDLFLNIQLKLPNEYSLIENDTNKIADELHNKNLLVQKYLANSETSLKVSWAALAFALISGLTQFYFFWIRPQQLAKRLTDAGTFDTPGNEQNESMITSEEELAKADEATETTDATEAGKAG